VREAADHEGRRERPRLRRSVDDFVDIQPDLLLDLAPHGFFDGFALVDEAREGTVEAGRPGLLAAEDAAVARPDDHDHHRVCAREVFRLAGRALARGPGVARLRGVATTGAEAVAVVPVEHLAPVGHGAGIAADARRQRSRVVEGAAFDAKLDDGVGEGREVNGEVGDLALHAQEHGWVVLGDVGEDGAVEPHELRFVLDRAQGVELPVGQVSGVRRGEHALHPLRVSSLVARAVQGIARKGDVRHGRNAFRSLGVTRGNDNGLQV
jgi:hypothetical protein